MNESSIKDVLLIQSESFRLQEDIQLIQKGIEDNKEVAHEEKESIFKKFGKNIGNSVKKSRTESLEKELAKDQARLLEVNPEKKEEEPLADLAKKELDVEAKKVAFALYYLANDSFEYANSSESEEALSLALFGNKEALSNYEKELEANFRTLTVSLFSGMKYTEEVKAALGEYFKILNQKVEGKCALCSAKALLGEGQDKVASCLGFLLTGENGLPYCNDQSKGTEAFLALTKEDVQALLPLKATLIQESKKGWTPEQKKANVQAIVSSLASLVSGLYQAFLLDGKDEEFCKDKIKILLALIDDLKELLK